MQLLHVTVISSKVYAIDSTLLSSNKIPYGLALIETSIQGNI